jgi:tryptophan 2-monooxygenase
VIGAGAAGLVAAYELLKIGATPVIFEADPRRLGGRAYSLPFTEGGQPVAGAFAEMGAMRFPASGRLFFHYVRDVFGLPATHAFPNPGCVPTTLCYQGTVLDWPAGTASPEGFADIARAWSDFVSRLVAPLHAAWRKGQRREVVALWQHYIDRYKDMSFAAAVREGIPAWTDRDLQRFGALGLGSGGFGPLFPCGFLELLRILVNMWMGSS